MTTPTEPYLEPGTKVRIKRSHGQKKWVDKDTIVFAQIRVLGGDIYYQLQGCGLVRFIRSELEVVSDGT